MSHAGLEVWPKVLTHLRSQHPSICRKWFEEELTPVVLRDGTLSIRAQSDFHRDYLTRTCADAFTDALQTVTGRLLTVRFLGPNDSPEPATNNNPAPVVEFKPNHTTSGMSNLSGLPDPPMQHNGAPTPTPALNGTPPALRPRSANTPHHGTLVINPDNDFNTFVVGPSNRLAHAASVAVATNPGGAYNPLFIHGVVGLGKTHLLQAICLNILKANPEAVVCYISSEGFVSEFVAAIKQNRMADFRKRFREVDVLVIDDIHGLAKFDQTQDEFFHTFNALYQASKQIVLSSDAPPEAIPDLGDRLVSRFKWGLVACVEPPSFETRVQILKTKGFIRGFDLPDEVAMYIAEHVDSNIRELEGQVVKLQHYTSVTQRPLDLALAEEALGYDLEPKNPASTTIQAIIDAVVDHYKIRLTDLQSKARTRSVALPRQVCMYLAKHNTHHSLQDIGAHFGGRDHTTVLHAVRTIQARRDEDEQFNSSIRTLEQQLRTRRR